MTLFTPILCWLDSHNRPSGLLSVIEALVEKS
jgi:hypothetical protein